MMSGFKNRKPSVASNFESEGTAKYHLTDTKTNTSAAKKSKRNKFKSQDRSELLANVHDRALLINESDHLEMPSIELHPQTSTS
jgi:hypothetical protein